MAPPVRSLAERFWPHVRKTRGCWLWTAGTDKDGYGTIRLARTPGQTKGSMSKAHRVSWMLHHGPIPKGKHVLHHCDTPGCVRPDHLYIGTPVENGRDLRVRHRSPKRHLTHCKHGHKFSPANTYWRKNGTRACATCRDRRDHARDRRTTKENT